MAADHQRVPVLPSDPGWREAASQRIEQWTALPLLVLSLLIIPILLIPSLVNLPPAAQSALTAADWAIWVAFAAEYVARSPSPSTIGATSGSTCSTWRSSHCRCFARCERCASCGCCGPVRLRP